LHFIKTRFIDNPGKDIRYFEFGFNDNPTMSEEFIEKMKENYTGVFLDRMIYGKWIGDLERLIVPEFVGKDSLIVERERPKHFELYGALDPAMNDFTAYLLGYYDFRAGVYYVEGEYVINKVSTNQIADGIVRLENELFPEKKVQLRVSDTALQLIYDLCSLHDLQFTPTAKDNKEAALNHVRVLIGKNRLFIHPRCKTLIRQLKTGTWNKQKTDFERKEGEGHFDCIDALIYLIRSIDKYINPYPEFEKDVQEDTHYINKRLKMNKVAAAIMGVQL
jgi:hypothetical protein